MADDSESDDRCLFLVRQVFGTFSMWTAVLSIFVWLVFLLIRVGRERRPAEPIQKQFDAGPWRHVEPKGNVCVGIAIASLSSAPCLRAQTSSDV